MVVQLFFASLATVRASSVNESALSKRRQLRLKMFDYQTKPTSMFVLVKSLASAVVGGHPFENILTADVLVDILNASASSEVLSDLLPRDMNVVFVSPDFNDQNSELLMERYRLRYPFSPINVELLKRFETATSSDLRGCRKCSYRWVTYTCNSCSLRVCWSASLPPSTLDSSAACLRRPLSNPRCVTSTTRWMPPWLAFMSLSVNLASIWRIYCASSSQQFATQSSRRIFSRLNGVNQSWT